MNQENSCRLGPCCQTCRFSKLLGKIQRLVCRRFPPNFMERDGNRNHYHFPVVNPEEWCGEFQARHSDK